MDMLNIYEVNRKEGARLFLDLPRWWAYRTFKGRDEIQEEEGKETMQWVLECTAIEVSGTGTMRIAFLTMLLLKRRLSCPPRSYFQRHRTHQSIIMP